MTTIKATKRNVDADRIALLEKSIEGLTKRIQRDVQQISQLQQFIKRLEEELGEERRLRYKQDQKIKSMSKQASMAHDSLAQIRKLRSALEQCGRSKDHAQRFKSALEKELEEQKRASNLLTERLARKLFEDFSHGSGKRWEDQTLYTQNHYKKRAVLEAMYGH